MLEFASTVVNTDQMQVEETLNNSNDLFLTFRKEMEEMSKKTKRLEKENQNLTRNKEITNRNIGEMVEERTKMQEAYARKEKELADARKRIERLEHLCRGMQAQGRGRVELEEEEEMTESEYDYEDEDEEGSGEYDDDTEEDVLEPVPEQRPFGPVPPPPPPPQGAVNGKVNGARPVNGQVNGMKR